MEFLLAHCVLAERVLFLGFLSVQQLRIFLYCTKASSEKDPWDSRKYLLSHQWGLAVCLCFSAVCLSLPVMQALCLLCSPHILTEVLPHITQQLIIFILLLFNWIHRLYIILKKKSCGKWEGLIREELSGGWEERKLKAMNCQMKWILKLVWHWVSVVKEYHEQSLAKPLGAGFFVLFSLVLNPIKNVHGITERNGP